MINQGYTPHFYQFKKAKENAIKFPPTTKAELQHAVSTF